MKSNKSIIKNFKKSKYEKINSKKQNNKINKKRKKYPRKKNVGTKNIKLKKKHNIKCILIIISFILIVIFSLFAIIVNYFSNIFDDEDDNIPFNNETIFYQEKFDSYKDAFNKAKNFIDTNMKGILINTEKVKLSKKPKASVVIPCMKCQKFITKAIRSVQNQDLSNFEIIIVNDLPNNDTIRFLEQSQKEENRIRIIYNKKNSGILYSRSIGALSSNGKYIFILDSDDILLDKDVLLSITNIADKSNIDLIIFESVYTDLKPNVFSTKIKTLPTQKGHKPNLVLFQPDLGYYPITPSHNLAHIHLDEILIAGKCVKTKIYKKALNKLGIERYSRHIVSCEDIIANIMLFNTARIAKFIPKYGYIYIIRKGSSSRIQFDKVLEVLNYLFVLDVLIDFSQELPKNKKILVNLVNWLMSKSLLKDGLNRNEYNYKTFISCLDRILNCKYISEELKNEVRIRGKKLDFIKYKF